MINDNQVYKQYFFKILISQKFRDLSKIFEYYSCIQLTQEFNTDFKIYDDIDPDFKENNQMSCNDTGIDCSNLKDSIVQCKLRSNNLTWRECGTFFGSQNSYDQQLQQTFVKWSKLIITRNSDSKLSKNLIQKQDLFIDKQYDISQLISFCENLQINQPQEIIEKTTSVQLRDYQIESISQIDNDKNVIICMPTGTGKNIIIIFSFKDNQKYLILVPKIILMEQLYDEIIKYKPHLKKFIQLIGDGNQSFNPNILITICVFNSIDKITEFNFHKIFIDESHHIEKPQIYIFDDHFENDDEKTYIQKIRQLVTYNNNVYLSATIDPIDGFIYYKKDIREMIEQKFLCDYTIKIPIFNDDPTNQQICSHLLEKYQHIIIYCNSQEEGKQINQLLNELQPNCSDYVDCHTNKKQRKEIIQKYNNGQIPFLVNVRILVEGFDAPITQGVCFLHLLSSSTTIIQIIGRALRLHPQKLIANIILPFQTNDDEQNISKFLGIIAQNDSRINKFYKNKSLGGYIQIEKVNEEQEINQEIEFKYNLVYNSLGILLNREEIWYDKLLQVKTYIDEHKEKPFVTNKDKNIKVLGSWIQNQQTNHKKKEYIMKNQEIYDEWLNFVDQYKEYFIDNQEVWYDKLLQVKTYINEHKEKPFVTNKDQNIKSLGYWISDQQKNHKKKEQIMKNQEIYNVWLNFVDEYKEYFMDNQEVWYEKLLQVKTYMNEHKKRPSSEIKDKNIKVLGAWIGTQQTKHKKKEYIMKNQEIYNKWLNFVDEYKEYFIDNQEVWYEKLLQVKTYINEHSKRPSHHNKDKSIKVLGAWINTQQNNHKKKQEIMKNQEIYNEWLNFVDEYKEYFMDNKEVWYDNLQLVKTYMNEHKKRPSQSNKDKNIKALGQWINTQQQNHKKKEYIMNNEQIYNEWLNFVDEYKEYF